MNGNEMKNVRTKMKTLALVVLVYLVAIPVALMFGEEAFRLLAYASTLAAAIAVIKAFEKPRGSAGAERTASAYEADRVTREDFGLAYDDDQLTSLQGAYPELIANPGMHR